MPAERISATAPSIPAAPRLALSPEPGTRDTANRFKTVAMNIIEFFLSPEAIARQRIAKAGS